MMIKDKRSEERRVGKEWRDEVRGEYSSRRRHTRSKRDWSSDVCSSDLVAFMNEDFFNDLPEDIQKAVEDTLLESMEYQREEARKQDEEGMEVIEEDMEITELDDDQRQEFIDAVEPIYEKYEDAIGSDLMEMARSYMDED